MKRLAFAIGVLALGFAASTPARADYALVKFESGYCRIWWDSAGNPFGVGWIKVAVGLPDYEAAVLAEDWDAVSAWSRSQVMSSISSMPTESRTMSGVTPADFSSSSLSCR